MTSVNIVNELREQALAGETEKYHEANEGKGSSFGIASPIYAMRTVSSKMVCLRIAGMIPADGVVTGLARVNGKAVAIMANDSTVKAALGICS